MSKSVRWSFVVLFVLGSCFGYAQMPKDSATGNKRTVYLFSGLGADSSVFNNLELPGYNKVYIKWIPAEHNESLTSYAGRIKNQITAPNPYFIGLSFGGIVAVEVSKQVRVDKMALISTAKTRDDLNRIQCFFMKLGLYKIIPGSLLRHSNFLTYSYFGVKSPMDKEALSKLLRGTDITFFRWALRAIAFWDNREAPERVIQIHGTADRVIPCWLVHPDYKIKGGGHLMVYNKADTINQIINNYFNN